MKHLRQCVCLGFSLLCAPPLVLSLGGCLPLLPWAPGFGGGPLLPWKALGSLRPHPSPLVLWMAFSSFLSFSREGSCHPGLGAPLLKEARGPISPPSAPLPAPHTPRVVSHGGSVSASLCLSLSLIPSPVFLLQNFLTFSCL